MTDDSEELRQRLAEAEDIARRRREYALDCQEHVIESEYRQCKDELARIEHDMTALRRRRTIQRTYQARLARRLEQHVQARGRIDG